MVIYPHSGNATRISGFADLARSITVNDLGGWWLIFDRPVETAWLVEIEPRLGLGVAPKRLSGQNKGLPSWPYRRKFDV